MNAEGQIKMLRHSWENSHRIMLGKDAPPITDDELRALPKEAWPGYVPDEEEDGKP